MASLNINTELFLANTTNNSGSLTLPSATSVPGRVIQFKDSAGTFLTKNLTIICSGSDTFEDGATRKIMNTQYGSIQFVASGTKWYILNGTQANTLQVTTMNAKAISSFNISTSYINASSIGLIDNINSTNLMNVSSSYLFYNNYIVSGTRVGYSNILSNKSFFSPASVPNLDIWIDASISTNVVLNSGLSTLRFWNDKSKNQYTGTVTNTLNYLINSQNALNTVQFFSTPATVSQLSFPPQAMWLTANSDFAIISALNVSGVLGTFAARNGANILSSAGQSFYGFYLQGQSVNNLRYAVNGNGGQFGLNILNNPSITGFAIVALVITGATSALYLNGTLLGSGSSLGQAFNTASSYAIGPIVFGGVAFNQNIGEQLCYTNQTLTNYQRQQIEGYLAWKWFPTGGNILPVSHPFYSVPP